VTSHEMALAPSQWSIRVANERGGHSRQLPDLAYQPASDSSLPVAVMVVHGQSNPRRERVALDGWRGSILAGQYAQVRWVTGPADARHLTRLATELGLTAPQFMPVNTSCPTSSPHSHRFLRTPTADLWPSRRRQCRSIRRHWPLLISRGLHRRTLSHSVQAPRSPQ
jgi:hypothetical protein